MKRDYDQFFDIIIVGAGAAGCVLAGRLSEAPEIKVLLIEAGPDAPPEQEHADIRDPFPLSLGNPSFSWPKLIAEVGADPGGGRPRFSRHYLQGYGVGGSSNIQGMAANRGRPADYNEWRDSGMIGWGWEDVLPYFNKLEHDLDFFGPLHGDSGPMPVRRVVASDWAPFSKAVGNALKRRGYSLIEDSNADFREGFSPMPMCNLPDQRVSASIAYLTKEVRRRPNLTILSGAFVERLDVDADRVCGVAVRTATGQQRFSAGETIVACGALYSPALLMRSGLGPGRHLQEMGVEVVRDLAGVGRNLQNHPEVTLVTHLPHASMQPVEKRSWQQNCMYFSSHINGCTENDMFVATMNKGGWHPLGRRIGSTRIAVYKSYSKGTVELAGSDPTVEPKVRFNLLSDSRDFARLVIGLRMFLQVFMDPEVTAVRNNELFVPNNNMVSRLNKHSSWVWLQSRAIAAIFDLSPVRRALLKSATLDVGALLQDEDALRELVRQRANPAHHVCGTCKMGNADDPGAVVDHNCRVRGINGLRVVDASIFPTIPTANLHFPVLMVAEKMAEEIKVGKC
ncbi:MAG: GMC family oxidoreductase N-terminal domain-containing protein [Sterolibacterium sp.]|nr:GMC family oxidoreductase N-terminal domain-containing protein [Sterolibacterium sp.]